MTTVSEAISVLAREPSAPLVSTRAHQTYVGDLIPAFVADARDCTGRAMDWTGWTLTFRMAGPVVRSGPATGDALGVITYAWQAGDTEVPGEYLVTIIGVSPAPESKQRTFVVDGLVRITVP